VIRAAVLAVVALAVLTGCDSAQRHAPSAHDSRAYPPRDGYRHPQASQQL